ncbi:MAG: rhodanese-like domain-containing protein [Pyrinomonadaceae bacterium]|nr:rhodanese-like domain-containing protein [Pyrinomonadaceae bacterium]
MSFKLRRLSVYALFLTWLIMVAAHAGNVQAYPLSEVDRPKSAAIEFIAAEELKSKISKNERITIIDVRSTASYTGGDNKIKGAIHVKLRRLKYRLSFPPLKSVPRDAEVITYCACPSDESAVHAAQLLLDTGFKRVRVLKGGWQEWQKIGGQVEARPKVSKLPFLRGQSEG